MKGKRNPLTLMPYEVTHDGTISESISVPSAIRSREGKGCISVISAKPISPEFEVQTSSPDKTDLFCPHYPLSSGSGCKRGGYNLVVLDWFARGI